MDEDELFVYAKNIQAPFSLVQVSMGTRAADNACIVPHDGSLVGLLSRTLR